MMFLPILGELFSSDSIIFMVIGLIAAIVISLKMKDKRKILIGLILSVIVYACCEILSNFHTNYMMELLLLFIGTAAIGSFIEFFISAIVGKVKIGKNRF